MNQRRAWLKSAVAGAGFGVLGHARGQMPGGRGSAASTNRLDGSPAAPPTGGALLQRLGVLLPKSGGPLQRAAAAVRAGIEEAFRREGRGYVIDIYELDDTPRQMSAAYRGMVERGTSLVLGPMTRDGVAALNGIGDVPITTLALNQGDAGTLLPTNVLSYNLSAEVESRQMADEALRLLAGPGRPGDMDGVRGARTATSAATSAGRSATLPRAIVVAGPSQAARRGAAAFAARWQEQGAEVAAVLDLAPAGLYKFRPIARRQAGDLYFLSMDTDLAVPVRTIVGNRIPIFGTSMMSIGGPDGSARAPELEGVRVLDMPAILVPSYVTRAGYSAAPSGYPVQLQRLYAMGIDALRIARALQEGGSTFEFNGLTGRLRFDGSTPQILRTALLAQYQDGLPITF